MGLRILVPAATPRDQAALQPRSVSAAGGLGGCCHFESIASGHGAWHRPRPLPGPAAPDRCDSPPCPSPKGQTKHSKYLIRAREPRRPPRPLHSRLAPLPARAALRGNEAGNGRDRSRPGAGWGGGGTPCALGVASLSTPSTGLESTPASSLFQEGRGEGESLTGAPLLRGQM